MIEFALTSRLGLTSGYQRKEDKGAALGFESVDENLQIGLKWHF